MKIYTRTGDEGSTGLFGGDRVPKHHQRLVAYGTLDELNSLLGVVALHLAPGLATAEALRLVQQDLFALGAVLATPPSHARQLGQRMTRHTWSIAAMEADIDRLTDLAPPMTHFVLPGGGPGSAYAHLARTVCRRAEREVVALAAGDPVPPEVVIYLNRLSDWLFALARAANVLDGIEDVQWLPQQNE
jgi:cob(I)alamin adenosyltransferase